MTWKILDVNSFRVKNAFEVTTDLETLHPQMA